MSTKNLRASMNDPEYRGEDTFVDKNLRLRGPLKDRKCTDLLFTLLFLAFAGVMVWIGEYGMKNGETWKLTNPVDQDGKLCGHDYPDHPYAYFVIQWDNPNPEATPVVASSRT
jgi:solute carrier family 44 (choline transporter-like protein), member 2/4/5